MAVLLQASCNHMKQHEVIHKTKAHCDKEKVVPSYSTRDFIKK